MTEIEIKTEYITLAQLLKLANCISTGGQAKHFIQSYEIKVNEQPENRRGRKLYGEDVIRVEGFGQFRVVRA